MVIFNSIFLYYFAPRGFAHHQRLYMAQSIWPAQSYWITKSETVKVFLKLSINITQPFRLCQRTSIQLWICCVPKEKAAPSSVGLQGFHKKWLIYLKALPQTAFRGTAPRATEQLQSDCHKGADGASAASDISPHINPMTREQSSGMSW